MTISGKADREGQIFTPYLNNPVPRHYKFFMKGGFTLTELKNFKPIRINTLPGYENVKDCYFLMGYDVVNTLTGHKKILSFMKRHYPYVTLETKDITSNKKCLLHRLLALAYLKNENDSIALVEHLDDNPLNYDLSNLKFSSYSENIKRAFINGHPNRIDKIFAVNTIDNKIFKDTMKELSAMLNIPRQTLYCRYYKQTPGRKIQSITLIENYNDRSTD